MVSHIQEAYRETAQATIWQTYKRMCVCINTSGTSVHSCAYVCIHKRSEATDRRNRRVHPAGHSAAAADGEVRYGDFERPAMQHMAGIPQIGIQALCIPQDSVRLVDVSCIMCADLTHMKRHTYTHRTFERGIAAYAHTHVCDAQFQHIAQMSSSTYMSMRTCTYACLVLEFVLRAQWKCAAYTVLKICVHTHTHSLNHSLTSNRFRVDTYM